MVDAAPSEVFPFAPVALAEALDEEPDPVDDDPSVEVPVDDEEPAESVDVLEDDPVDEALPVADDLVEDLVDVEEIDPPVPRGARPTRNQISLCLSIRERLNAYQVVIRPHQRQCKRSSGKCRQ